MDRSGLQVFTFPISHDMSGQLKSPQRIICFCFELLVIVVRDLFKFLYVIVASVWHIEGTY